jgi:hypothetical protein
MATNTTEYVPLNITAGVQPTTDNTRAKTPHYTYADKIRFVDGMPEKIGGWIKELFALNATVSGTARTIFSEIINGKDYSVIGTNKKLYAKIGSFLTNITPLLTSTIAIANSLDTHYNTLGSNPLSAVNGSPIVTVTDASASRLKAGDKIYLSGATGFAGILAGALNGDAIVRSVSAGSFTINVGVNATSTASGGGSSVVRSSGLVKITHNAHGQLDGDRVKIASAVDFGGILAAEINKEFAIRNVATNSFEVMTIGEPTSAVTGGGGASTVYSKEIPEGALNESVLQGYGAGFYGMGLYGTALVSNSARALPRIWFCDRYGERIIVTAGNQSPVYRWDGSPDVAPIIVPNAPTEINYAFISNNILVVFGEDGVENRITGSDQGDIENWVSSSVNQVFRDDIEGAGRLLSHCSVGDYNLIYTDTKTYRFRYIGQPFVWEITEIDSSVGIIAPMARVPVKGMAFWMGQSNFYMYRGGSVEVIPSNTQNQSTVLNYVFNNLNWGQKSKCFAWFNKAFNEVWFHYPSANSNECDRVAVVNILDFNWTIHELDRTCAEYPKVSLKNPRLMNVSDLYQHENGKNDDGSALPFTLSSNMRYYGKSNAFVQAIIPDSLQDSNVNFNIKGYQFPQSVATTYDNTYPVSVTGERITSQISARFNVYTWSGAELNQSWSMGEWFEEIKRGSPE